MAQYPTVKIRISRRFWEDHTWSRQLPGGVLVRTMKHLVEVDATRWEIIELISDASFYAFSQDECLRGDMVDLMRSAKSVYVNLSKIELPDGPDEQPFVEAETPIVDEDAKAAAAARVIRRKQIRAEHELTETVDLGEVTFRCGCGCSWTGWINYPKTISESLDAYYAHRKSMTDAA